MQDYVKGLVKRFDYIKARRDNWDTHYQELGDYMLPRKADIVKNISDQTGVDKTDVQMIAEKFMEEIKNSLENNNNVYLRGFGSFIIKTRAEKTGRNISKNTAVIIPAHNIPAFKPSKTFVKSVKQNVPVG